MSINDSKTVSRKRMVSIDIMAAMMLVLVVVGHHTFEESPGWYSDLHAYIYSFHMAVFICISGFLIAYTGNRISDMWTDYRRALSKVVKFFGLTLLVGGLAIMLEAFMIGQIGDSELWVENLRLLLLYPMGGPAQFLWYIYMLSWMYMVYPVFKRLPNALVICLCVASAFAGSLESTRFLGMDLLCRYGFFYLLGIIVCRYSHLLQGVSYKWGSTAGVPFLVYSAAFCFECDYVRHVPFVVSGLLALPFFGIIARLVASKSEILKGILMPVSRNLLPLYLWQMFFIQAFHLVLAKFYNLGEYYALYVALSSILTIVCIIWAVNCYRYAKNIVMREIQ